MVDFTKLRKKSSESFGTLNKAIEKLSNNNNFDKDKENFWFAAVDKDGNGSAIIRFLPSQEFFTDENADEGDTLFVRLFGHGFQGPTGKWYIENSLTTLGQDDPVSKHNSELWNTGIEAKKEIARKQKRRLNYISNILVVKDPANPENNGKVFLFKYGKKIFDHIKGAMVVDPNFEDEVPVNAFDLFESGANFRLKIRKVDGYTNYDKSEFDKPSPLTEDQLEYVSKNVFPIKPLVAADKFKTYEELEKRLFSVLDISPARNNAPVQEEKEKSSTSTPALTEEKSVWDDDESDGDLDYFKKLTEE